MAPSIFTTVEILSLVFCWNRQDKIIESAATSQNWKHKEQDDDAASEMSIVVLEHSEKTDIYLEKEPPPYEETTDYSVIKKTAMSRYNHLSIAKPKFRRSFLGTREIDEKVVIDPKDEEAARLAEEEEDEFMLKKKDHTSQTEEQNQKPSRLRRLTSKFEPRLNRSKDMKSG